MAPFVRVTYNLEGDGLLALKAISTLHYPNVLAIAKSGGASS